MKRTIKKGQNLIKGTSSAIGLSLLIHAGLFLLAGTFVVFTVTKKKEMEFTSIQAIERPRMKLKKPKVKVKRSAKPRLLPCALVKVQKVSMPDIQLPEIVGLDESLDDPAGGLELMSDQGEGTIFGSGQTIGNDFVGTFYDFLRDRSGRRIELSKDYPEFLRGFVRGGWKESYFSRYYRSPKKLYATTCMFPCIQSVMARVAFNEFEEGQIPNDYRWAILYKGQLVYKEAITFRFWGMGSSFLIVRVDGRTVLDAPKWLNSATLDPAWHTTSTQSYKYWIGNGVMTVGDWITLEPNKPLSMEYLFSDWGGGEFSANLLVEVQGEKYPKNRQNGPILPVFKTAELSYDQLDRIMEFLVYDSACLTNGPVFCDYNSSPKIIPNRSAQTENLPEAEPQPEDSFRCWTLSNGATIEGRFKTVVANTVILETAPKKLKKISIAQLCEDDRKIVELAMPPKFNVNYSKTFSKRTVPPTHLRSGWEQPKLFDYTFHVILKQISSGTYNHPLTVEYFAIGKQINSSDTYILLDRQKSTFTPVGANKTRFEMHGDPVLLFDHVLYSIHMGQKPFSYLVTITDERGKIIQYSTPSKWLFEHLENLKEIPVGKFMDKHCLRTHPECPDIGTRRNGSPWG